MIKKTAVVSIFIFLVGFAALAAATPEVEAYFRVIRSIKYENSDQLVEMVKDDKIIAPIKVKTIQRIIEIYTADKEKAAAKAPAYVDSISYALKNSREDNARMRHYTVRTEACFALSNFDGTAQASAALDGIKNGVLEEKNVEVLGSCVNALSHFKQSSELASQKLLEMLDIQLDREVLSETDIKITIAILGALSRQNYPPAFVPLLRVLQSGYPENVKLDAQRGLDNILAKP